jgi:hypothetical protein
VRSTELELEVLHREMFLGVLGCGRVWLGTDFLPAGLLTTQSEETQNPYTYVSSIYSEPES